MNPIATFLATAILLFAFGQALAHPAKGAEFAAHVGIELAS